MDLADVCAYISVGVWWERMNFQTALEAVIRHLDLKPRNLNNS